MKKGTNKGSKVESPFTKFYRGEKGLDKVTQIELISNSEEIIESMSEAADRITSLNKKFFIL